MCFERPQMSIFSCVKDKMKKTDIFYSKASKILTYVWVVEALHDPYLSKELRRDKSAINFCLYSNIEI